jgi:hypothetical protein
MQKSSREWLVPLTGIAFLVFLIVSFIVQGEPKDAKHPVNEIVSWYVDNKDQAQIGAVLGVIAAVFLVFFGAYLRKVLEAAEGPNAMLPILSLIGLSIVGVGAAIDGTILFATAEAADDIAPTSVQALQALWDNDFLPVAFGVIVFLWSTGISVLRSGALPKWLGWVAILLGIVSVTPIGFAGAIGAAVWIVIVSIMLSLRARSGGAAPASPAPPSPSPSY